VTPPWNPAAIKLSTEVGLGDWPGHWTVRADVRVSRCPPDIRRHVGHVELALVDLTPDAQRDAPLTGEGEWVRAFLTRAVRHTNGTLVAELEQLIAPGPSRVIILRHMYLHDAWRGRGLAGPLLAAVLRPLAPLARLAACRVEPDDIQSRIPGLVPAEARWAARHSARVLGRAGFVIWNHVHLTALHAPDHRTQYRRAYPACGDSAEDAAVMDTGRTQGSRSRPPTRLGAAHRPPVTSLSGLGPPALSANPPTAGDARSRMSAPRASTFDKP
jgi:GNAT superfamily N-acetyltransferase